MDEDEKEQPPGRGEAGGQAREEGGDVPNDAVNPFDGGTAPGLPSQEPEPGSALDDATNTVTNTEASS